MFFLGTHIRQDEHGRCTLLSPRTSPPNTAELQESTQRILTRLQRTFYQRYAGACKEDSRGIRAGAWPMSGVYWGIVTGLLAMVGTLFVCIDILYGSQGGSSNSSGDALSESNQAVGSGSSGSRRAA